MNLLEYLKLRNISFEDILKKKLKTAMDLPFNNRTDYGNSIKTKLTNTISISNPKFWPKKGYSEKKIK
jgi:hypothetical protein